MIDDDQDIPVIDLSATDDGAPEDRDAIVAEALAHAALLEAQYRQPLVDSRRTGRWKAPLAMIVFALSAYILVFPPAWVRAGEPATASAEDIDHGVRAALYLQAQQVEAFRVRRGRLPRSLDEVQGALPGITLVRSSERLFQLVSFGADGRRIIYDSSRPADQFEAAAAAWDLSP